MIRECPVTLECRLEKTVLLPTHTLFVGEIMGAYADGNVIKEGKPDFPAINPLFLTMPDNRYWMLGNHAGDAWSAGKNLMHPSHKNTHKGR
jgi:flavin reductase (DIM6/NTAB) family NADH-FMN oxidoreductase RutF